MERETEIIGTTWPFYRVICDHVQPTRTLTILKISSELGENNRALLISLIAKAARDDANVN